MEIWEACNSDSIFGLFRLRSSSTLFGRLYFSLQVYDAPAGSQQ
jgi:hypothetical protein